MTVEQAQIWPGGKGNAAASKLPGIAWLAIAVAALVPMNWRGLESLIDAWSKPEYSHGWFIPLIAAYLFLRVMRNDTLHYDPAGLPIDAVSLEPYLGPCRVVDARGCDDVIGADLVDAHWSPGVTRMLFRTFDRFPMERWPERFTTVSAGAIQALSAHGVILVGLDSPSLDPETSKTMDAHLSVPRDMRILEGLVLDHVPPGDYELIALPLPLAGLDASPVRAVLRELD